MPLAAAIDVTTLPAFRAEELPLWNWQAAFLPDARDWREWLSAAAGALLREPRIAVAQLSRATAGETAQVIALEPGRALRIGRATENDVVLEQATVTRQHAEVRWDNGSPWLVDLGSGMGTMVKGAKIPPNVPVELADGAEFVIFPYRFVLKLTREWAPVREVALHQTRQTVRSQAEYLADHTRGFASFVFRTPAGERLSLAVEEALLAALTRRMLAPLGVEESALTRRAWHELLVLGAVAEANRGLLPTGHLTLCKGGLPGDEVRGVECRALLEVAGERGVVTCFLPFPLLEALRVECPRREVVTLADRASLAFPVSRGRVTLTLREQRSLEPGDVVLYDAAPALLWPGDDRRGWALRESGEAHFQVANAMERRDVMTEPLADIGDLSLTVEIVLGQKQMTIREAGALAPGAVIDLERTADEPVRLAVNGQVIGAGHLVTVDGRLGVRIAEWTGERA